MGLFERNEKEKCPICGKEMGLMNQTSVDYGNAFICNECAAKLRGDYNLQNEFHRSMMDDRKMHMRTEDSIRNLTLYEIREILSRRNAEQSEVLGEYRSYPNVFKGEDVFSIAPKPMDVGIFRAKAYKNRRVVKGMMAKGSFQQKDIVTLHNDGTTVPVEILELIPCDGIDFDTNMKSRLHKKTVEEGGNAWLILDLTDDIPYDVVLTKENT